jgi:CheY-like chemotaxis protein
MTRSILVIDDDPSVRYTVGRILSGQGITTVFAENGKQGLELIGTAAPSLIITDIVMPEKEGLETIMEIRKRNPKLRIIAISGGGRVGASETFLKTARALGANDVLTKPFEPEQLRAVVSRQLAEISTQP